ncbi:MAG: hypothetical protein AB2L20_30085 [Mangrovibacterium sp.]
MELLIYNKSGQQIASTGDFNYSASAMGEKSVSLTIESPIKLPIVPLCYLTFKGENFYLQNDPTIKRVAASGYRGDALQYSMTFKSKQTDLVNCDFLDHLLGAETYYSGMGEFSFFGDVYDLGRRIQANLNIEGNGWIVKMPRAGYSDPQPVANIGVSDRTLNSETKQITVSDENCWNALVRAYDDFGFNFYLDTTNRLIYIGVTYPMLTVGGEDITFEYGYKKGLYEISRNVEDSAVITRLRAYGSDKNIPEGYMLSGQRLVSRLQLPSYRSTQSDPVPTDYILASQNIIDYYGIRPGKKVFDDIYPTIEGVVDANSHPIDTIHSAEEIIDGVDENGDYLQPSFWIRVYDMGFDINQLFVSEAAKVVMKSGLCASAEFDIVEAIPVPDPQTGEDVDFYNEGVRWKYRLEKNSSFSSNYILPSGNMLISAGNKFSLINISLPDTLVIAAEAKLLDAAQQYMAKNGQNKISYSISLDEIYLANNPLVEGVLKEGGRVKIIDNELGDTTDDNGVTHYTIKSIQSLTVRYQGNQPLPTYNISLSEDIIAGRIDRIEGEVGNTAENVNQTIVNNSRDRRNAVRNTRNLRALKNYTYDPDGYFDTTRLKPLSIETLYLAVGGKSGNFSTNGVKTKTYNDGGYKVNITAGFVNHREIWWTPVPEEGQDPLDPLLRPDSGSERYSWAINNTSTFTMTDDTKPYYVFARCSQIEGIGDWLVTTEQKAYKDNTYYYFEFGSIELPSEGRRDLVPTKGAFFVSGGQIYGDSLQSINYSEDNTNQGSKYGLNDGTIRVGNNQHGFTYTPGIGMRLYDPLVVSPGGGEFPIGVYRGAYDPLIVYYKGDEVTRFGSTWQYINDVPMAGQAPVEGVYWAIKAAKGADGSTLYTWLKYADDAFGNGISDDPAGKLYIGFAHNKTTSTESTNPADYTWSLIKGNDGDPGTNAPYWEYRYAKNGSTTTPPNIVVTDREPVGWTITIPTVGVLEYLWTTRTLVTSDGVSIVQNWSDPARLTGVPGQNGDQGPIGPSPVYQGIWVQDAGKTYYGTATRVDIVKFNGSYYVARTDAGTFTDTAANIPTNTAKWNSFGAQFESVATQLLFAELAYVENLGVNHLRTGVSSNARIAINRIVNESTGEGSNAIEVFEQGQTDSNVPVIKIDDTAGYDELGSGSYPGIEVRKNTVSKLSSIGIFANGSGHQFLPSTLGIEAKATGVFIGNGNVSGSDNYFAGAYADASNSGTSPTYAMIFGRDILVWGVVDGFMKTPSDRGIYDLPDYNTTLSSTYSSDKKYFFWGGGKTADRVYNLPDPADYESGEIIWFANGNDHNSELKARSGDTINGYAYDARWITLNGPTDFVEFMSNGSNMWRIVRSGGDNIVF